MATKFKQDDYTISNRDLLSRSHRGLLSHYEQQRQTILRIMILPVECPNCHKPVNQFEAMGVSVDDWRMTNNHEDYKAQHDSMKCPHCERGLEMIVPIFAYGSPYLWRLKLDAEDNH